MTERKAECERLVERINDFFGCDASYFDVNPFDLAMHLLDGGVIVPPVKVGQTIWDAEGNAWKVFAITIWQDCISLKTASGRDRHIRKTYTIGKHSIGKTVFLTKEAALQALKERERE